MMIGVYLSLVAFVVWLIWRYIMTPRSKLLPPGPKGIPILGNLLQLEVNDLRSTFDVWAKKYGPVVFVKLFNVDAVILSDAAALRRACCSPQYTKIINEKPYTFAGEYFLYGFRDVLFGMYTDTVMKTRTVMKKGLKMVDNMEALHEGGVKHLIDSLGETGGKDFDPKSYVSEAVGNIFSIMFTGETVSKEDAKLIFEFEDAGNSIVHPTVEVLLTNFPWLRHFPGHLGDKYRKACDVKERFLNRYHDTVKASYVEGKTRGLVDVFIQLTNQQAAEGNAAWFTEIEAKTSIIDMVGAGCATLFNGLNACFLTLLNHPEVASKMYEEVKREVGTSRFPCLEDRQKLPYSTAAMFECLRYTTHVNIVLPRRAGEEWHFDGYVIPKDTMMLGNLWTIHHDEKYFPDPWTFRPERFLEPNGDLIPPEHPTRQAFVPYGLGRRQCVGSTFADGRLFLFLTSLVQNFTLLPPENEVMKSCDPHDYNPRGIVMGPKAYKCRVIPRDPRPG